MRNIPKGYQIEFRNLKLQIQILQRDHCRWCVESAPSTRDDISAQYGIPPYKSIIFCLGRLLFVIYHFDSKASVIKIRSSK